MTPFQLAQRQPVPALPRKVMDWIVAWRDLQRSRAALGRLDDRLLQDVGISPERAAQEAARLWT